MILKRRVYERKLPDRDATLFQVFQGDQLKNQC